MTDTGGAACKIFETAIYLRLSRDDTDIDGNSKTESNSISSQRDLLRVYVKSHEDLRIFDIYVDDGWSGSSFDRPEFKRMMADVKEGKVNCVLVKDLSRFGRDYIEAGRLIQKTFPALSVRFIAVTDNYDSLLADKTDSSLVLPIKNFVNDSYCRDISVKVKAHQKVKRMEGKCISAFTVYGYLKNPDDKNQLITDKYAADIVKKIFAWKISGMSLGAIANKLNRLHILSPMEYKKLLGMKFYTGFEKASAAKWAAGSVKRILVNQVYLGNMVQGKQEKINYKIKKRRDKPQEEWISVKNTHEPIISQVDFEIVQNLLKYDSRFSINTKETNLFAGILFCADCKAPMMKRVNTYKKNKKTFYICQTKNKSKGCSRHSIEEEVLKDIVWKEIRQSTALMMQYDEIMNLLHEININCGQVIEYNLHIGVLQKEYSKYYALKNTLLTDLKEGLIDINEFDEINRIYKQKCNELDAAIKGHKDIIRQMYKCEIDSKIQLEQMRESFHFPELTRELIVKTIKTIYIHENKRMNIVFRYKEERIKRYPVNALPEAVLKNITKFNVGIYSRLSVDKHDKKTESIENQIDIIKQYVKQNNDDPDKKMELIIYDEYIDCGISGTTFVREGFERLMSDVRNKKVSCIIVKDFSRFGRDYIEAGNLIEKLLPFLGVRFISVADGFDSMSEDAENGKLAMNIKNLVNDMYAKDISKRVSIARKQSAKRGSYIGSFAPYGYKLNNENGIRYLTANKDAADIVRKIFEDFASGVTIEEITSSLFADKVHRISDFTKYGHVYCTDDEILHQWNNSVIMQLIANTTYTGDMVQGKKIRYEGQKSTAVMEEDEWFVVEDTHEAIVSKELFQRANDRIINTAENKKKQRTCAEMYLPSENIFCDIVYCGKCGAKLKAAFYQSTVTERRNYSYYCKSAYYKDERKCESFTISQKHMEEKVGEAIKLVFGNANLNSKILTEINQRNCTDKQKQYQKEIGEIWNNTLRQKKQFAVFYMQWKKGEINQEEYFMQKQSMEQTENVAKIRIQELERKIVKAGILAEEENKFLRVLVKETGNKKLNKELVNALIEKISVNPDRTMNIIFKFNDRGDGDA